MSAWKQKYKAFKQQWVSKPLFARFRKALPPLSDTEQQAIQAGTVSFEKTLFQGAPDWKALKALPEPLLTGEEEAFLAGPVENLCQMLDDWKITSELKDLPPEIWATIKREKIFGMIIPKEYGGLGFSALGHSSVITKIASRSGTTAVSCMVPNSLGPGELLMAYGTPEQKNHYLPRLAVGEEIPCFALTGPEAGSDASNIPDVGVVKKGQHNGKEVIGIELNFDKRYITLAPIATVMGLAFKLFDPDHLLGPNKDIGITLGLLPTNHPGIRLGTRHNALDLPFMNGPVRGNNVFIPLDWIIGGVEMAGQGWRMLMEALSAGRGISLPALSTATGQVCYRMTGAYSLVREQFNTPLCAFDGVQAGLARIGGQAYILESMRQFVAGLIMQGQHSSVVASIAKYHMTEMARQVMNDAMDIHGGKGIMLGPHNYLARMYQGVPVSITVEGANILTRCLMIFGQGAFRCHPFVQDEMKAAALHETDPDQALENFDLLIEKHRNYLLKNGLKATFYGLTVGYFSKTHKGFGFKGVQKKMNWLSATLSFTTELALGILGGKLKRKELLSARLGDCLSTLFMCSAVLKYHQAQNNDASEDATATWALCSLLHQAEEALHGFYRNADHWVFKVVKWLMFPLGRRCHRPADDSHQTIVDAMCSNNELRDRLTALCYIEDSPQDAKGVVEMAFQQRLKIGPLLQKIQVAVRAKNIPKKMSLLDQASLALQQDIIDEAAFQEIKSYRALYQNAIAVDEFPQMRNKDAQ